jgi:hypothetical protein
VDDDGADDLAAETGDAEGAPGVQDATLFRKEGRHLLGDVPVAGSLLGQRRRAEVFGQVECKAADERAVAAVDLDGRRDRIGRKLGGLPDLEGAVRAGIGRRLRLRSLRGHEVGEAGDLIDLREALLQLRLDGRALTQGHRRVARLDQPRLRLPREVEHRGIEGDRRHH